MKPHQNANIASALTRMAGQLPDTHAVLFPTGRNSAGEQHYERTTYKELDDQSTLIAAGLTAYGIGKGTRTVLMVKPSMEFFALTFGLFKAGIVPVFVDPGMGIKSLGICLAEAEPEAFVGIPKAHVARLVLGWGKKSIKRHVTVGRRLFWGGVNLDQIRELGRANEGFEPPGVLPDDMAAILFTSGSTGVPKGAVYSHGNFTAQVEFIRNTYDIQPGEIDLPTFPLFALFDPALGMTTVIPAMDFTKPASVDPRDIIEPIKQFDITNVFGSPALLNGVGRYGAENKVELPSVKRVISAGAPVPTVVLERITGMLVAEGAQVFTPYGATESLPVASVGSAEILETTAAMTNEGAGVCIGRPVAGVQVDVIQITDDAISTWSDDLRLPTGEIGEFVVRGPQVTKRYYNRDESTRLAKIVAEDGEVLHRMGDLGYFDDEGRMWFCGRKSHRVIIGQQTMFTVPIECIFNTHPDVFRTALVGVTPGAGDSVEPVLCVEREAQTGGKSDDVVRAELLAIAQAHELTKPVQTILFHPKFPVDIRHNSKIFREKLAVWAQKKV